ncbi:hypothetical protein Tco_0418812 [Tanacetum coccineum]
MCSKCKVFGHTDSTCGMRTEGINVNGSKEGQTEKNERGGFRREIFGYKANFVGIGGGNKVAQDAKAKATRQESRPITKKTNDTNITQTPLNTSKGSTQGQNADISKNRPANTSPWRINKETVEELRRSANKFVVLENFEESNDLEVIMQNGREIVKKYVLNQRQPTIDESKDWTSEMFGIAAWNEKREEIYGEILVKYKSIIDDKPWALIGDWNVSLHLEDHSEGGSSNIEFMSKFINSHVVFLPHLTSDHSPAVLYLPKMVRNKKKAFRFSNFVVDKHEFLNVVQEKWSIDIEGKEKLQEIQGRIDIEPHNSALKQMEAKILREYNIARQDEEKMLFQRAKIKWLSDGDKNSKYFHTVLKGRAHESRIEVVKNENGDKFKGIHVADQFVQHFHNFLGKDYPV